MNRVVFKSSNDNWKTPSEVYSALNKEFGFNFDPCPLAEDPKIDGLKIEWGG